MHVNTEAHIHTLVSRKKAVFFSLSIVVASTVLVLCGGVIGKVVFASAHHVEVGPVGRASSSSSIGSSAKQHVHAIQRPNLPAACTRWRTPARAATNYYYYTTL